MKRRRARLWLVALAVALIAPLAWGQGIPGRPRPVRQGVDSAQRPAPDSVTRNLPKANWAPLDSVALDLMKRPGMTTMRYQGEVVDFHSTTGVVNLAGTRGARAVVQRDQTALIADTIAFDQRSDSLRAAGDTIVMHDPSRGDDFFALGRLAYDIARKEGTAWDVSTSTTTSQTWYVEAHRAAFAAADSAAGRDNMFYGADGTITSCTDSVLHYHFAAHEIKRVASNFLVARNVTMYVMGVPVMWLPFIFQDTRSGRRSGMLTPRFGLTELVRNSPNYRRTVENLGYYFAFSDYLGLTTSLDWRSSADATPGDPGWTRWNGELQYRWLNRFATGSIGGSVMSRSDGSSNTQISWSHQQDFSSRSHMTASLNFSTSTTVQRETALLPLAALGTIVSQANYDRSIGSMKLSVGGTRKQYPGRPEVDMTFPTVSLSSQPVRLADWLTWTPSMSATTSSSAHIDSPGDFTSRFVQRADGTIDSVKVDRGNHSSSIAIGTPLKVFDFQINAAVSASDRGNDYPEWRTVVDPVDTSKKSTRVYERTWLSSVDFDLGMNLPNFFGGTWNLVPSVTLSNVASGAFLVRSERTGDRWVSQGKRLNYGLSMSPTFFALFGGFGPISRLRHSVTTSFSYTYSPAKQINPDYLAALGQTQNGFLGSLATNRVTLSIQQNIEAKFASPADTLDPEGGRKVKLLSMQFSPLSWDFERARHAKSGFATDHFDVSLRSDLLPGFDAGAGYSLFQGSVYSDSAVFSPFLESVHASFNIGAGSGIGGLFGRLFGGPGGGGTSAADTTAVAEPNRSSMPRPIAGGAGQSIRGSGFDVPSGGGFKSQLTFTLNQQRPPVGGHVVDYDPTLQCAPYKDINPLQYDICVRNAIAAPPLDVNGSQTTAGGTFFRVPPQMNVQASTSFPLTPKWAVSWSTNYDFQRSEFGMQSVTLRREMHDWNAVFSFMQAPNGNFTFTFFIELKAEPDIKFDYNRSSYGSQSGTTSR